MSEQKATNQSKEISLFNECDSWAWYG